MISNYKNFYYTSTRSNYNIFFKNIKLSLRKCQLAKIWNYLELKEKKLETKMDLCFYGTIYISLSIDEFIQLKSLVHEILSNLEIDGSDFYISKNYLLN